MECAFTTAGLAVTPALATTLAEHDILTPTAIQLAGMAPILAGQDVILQAPTGTGKTLAYLLPLLQRAAAEPDFRALVVAPSPELAIQISQVATAFAAPGVGCVALVGGGSLARQLDRLKKHPQILVGTPGRVIELIFMRKVKAARLRVLVLDEVDAILAEDRAAALAEICSRPEVQPQFVCASATVGPLAQAFVARFMRPEHLAIVPVAAAASAPSLSPLIDHRLQTFDPTRKEVALVQMLRSQRIARALIFVNKVYNVAHLERFLSDQGVPAQGLSADRGKQARERALTALRCGSIRLLVATDAIARGLDIRQLDWVIHYEVARDAEVYLHRAGRVGRAGRPGTSVVMAAPHECFIAEKHARTLGFTLARMPSARAAS